MPHQTMFDSEEEKEKLVAVAGVAAVISVMGAGLVKRYPKWGFRYMIAYGVFATLAAISYSLEDVSEGSQ